MKLLVWRWQGHVYHTHGFNPEGEGVCLCVCVFLYDSTLTESRKYPPGRHDITSHFFSNQKISSRVWNLEWGTYTGKNTVFGESRKFHKKYVQPEHKNDRTEGEVNPRMPCIVQMIWTIWIKVHHNCRWKSNPLVDNTLCTCTNKSYEGLHRSQRLRRIENIFFPTHVSPCPNWS